jgi:phenylacetate-CoA ligase
MLSQLKASPFVNALVRRPPFLYRGARAQIARVHAMDRPTLEAFLRQRLTSILSVARSLPGYAHAKAIDEPESWPILEKRDLAGREHAFLPPTALPHIPAATGGTTGQPMKLSRTLSGVAFEQAFIDSLCAREGIDFARARIAVLRGDSVRPPSLMTPPFWVDRGATKRVFSAHHLNRETSPAYVQALCDFAPEVLFCYPSALQALLDSIDDAPALQIPLILASSEVLPEEVSQRARERFRSSIIDFYGHAERVIAASSSDAVTYRFDPAYGVVELLPSADGLAEIIATSLHIHGQVFVRYRTGDLARVASHDPSYLREVALGLQPFLGVAGRAAEFIQLADGRRIIGLNHIPRGVEGVERVQLHHRQSGDVDIYVVTNANFGERSLHTLTSNLRDKFPADTHFRLFAVDGPVREPNGKAPLLLRNPVIEPLRMHRLKGDSFPKLAQNAGM